MTYDLSRIYVSIEHPDGTGFVESSPVLSSFKEFIDAGDDISKIAILSGDIDSPFTEIKDRGHMISAIFDYLKLNDRELFEGIVLYKSEIYVNSWTKYLFILNETLYTDWQLAKKDYEFFLMQSNKDRENISGTKDITMLSNLRMQIKKLGEEVRDIEAKLFPDSKAAREAAIAESKKKIKLYAESYAVPFNFY